MAVARPIKLPPRPTGFAKVLSRKNLPVAVLAVIALVLVSLISRDAIFPPSTTPAGLRTATVAVGTVTNSVSATGTLVPAQQMTLGFKTAQVEVNQCFMGGAFGRRSVADYTAEAALVARAVGRSPVRKSTR